MRMNQKIFAQNGALMKKRNAKRIGPPILIESGDVASKCADKPAIMLMATAHPMVSTMIHTLLPTRSLTLATIVETVTAIRRRARPNVSATGVLNPTLRSSVRIE